MVKPLMLQLAAAVFLAAPVGHAFLPQSFRTLVQYAAKVALVRVVQVDRSVAQVQVLAVLKGRFAGDTISIHDVRMFFLYMDGSKRVLQPEMQCFVLLNHDNTPLSPFCGSGCGGHNILVMGAAGLFQGRYNEVADAPMYATDIVTDLRALLLKPKRDDLLPEFNGEFAYRFQDFDHPNVPAPGLTEQALDEQLRLVLTAKVKEATAAAARIINGTRDIAGVAAAGAKVGTPTPQAQHRLQELLQDLKVVSARRLLLNPERHPVRLVGANLAGTMSALQQAFGWVPEPLSAADRSRLKPVRVTLNLPNASLAEALAGLGNQTGIGFYSGLHTLDISRAWGQGTMGGRGLNCGRAGILTQLSLSKYQSLKDDPKAGCSVDFGIGSAVPWLSLGNAWPRLDEVVFADGAQVTHLDEEGPGFTLPLAAVVANRGKVKLIKGQLTLSLPVTIGDRAISLAGDVPAEMETESGHFLERPALVQTPAGWKLSVAWGLVGGWAVGADCGVVVALAADGKVIEGECVSSGGGFSARGGVDRQSERWVRVFAQRPAAVRWTYPDLMEDYVCPVEFRDVQFPAAVWQPELPHLPEHRPPADHR